MHVNDQHTHAPLHWMFLFSSPSPHQLFSVLVHPSTTPAVFLCRSFLLFHLLILTPEGRRPAQHRCFQPKRYFFWCVLTSITRRAPQIACSESNPLYAGFYPPHLEFYSFTKYYGGMFFFKKIVIFKIILLLRSLLAIL